MATHGGAGHESDTSLNPHSLYTQKWYESFQDASYVSAKVLLRHFFSSYRPTSMIDIGAGIGLFLTVAKESGVVDLLGIEGDWVKGIHNPSIKFIYQNLEEPLVIDKRYDTVLCLEVAEHLSPGRADTFVDDICKASSGVIIFGAAMPFQGGAHHVNEQDPSYWIQKFAEHDYECIDFFRARLWKEPLALTWHAQNTFLYIKKDDPRRGLFCNQPLYDVYHPLFTLNSDVLKRHNIVYEDFIGARVAVRALLSRARRGATKVFHRLMSSLSRLT